MVYCRSKNNVNADALFKLIHLRTKHHLDNDHDEVYKFIATVVGLSMSMLCQLKEGYVKDKYLSLIYDNLKSRMDWKNDVLSQTISDDQVLPYNVL